MRAYETINTGMGGSVVFATIICLGWCIALLENRLMAVSICCERKLVSTVLMPECQQR